MAIVSARSSHRKHPGDDSANARRCLGGSEHSRRAMLQARVDRARLAKAEAEADSLSNHEDIGELRRSAEMMGADSDQGRDWLAFADRMERSDAAMLAEA